MAIDLGDVQGDILFGFPKKVQNFVFFEIDDGQVEAARTQLAQLIPLVTTTNHVLEHRQKIADAKSQTPAGQSPPLIKMSGVNIAFSAKGLKKLGVIGSTGDDIFSDGMLADASTLHDPGTGTPDNFDPAWNTEFKQAIDCLVLIYGESTTSVAATSAEIAKIFKSPSKPAFHELFRLHGHLRPPPYDGKEHFGFEDGISQPAVEGFNMKPLPGQPTVPPGTILMGREGDTLIDKRPSWALDGSILAFRHFSQLVPEFNTFLSKNALKDPGLTPEQGSEFLAARLMGRWKSGAPVYLAPNQDDQSLGADKTKNNNFDFTLKDDAQSGLKADRCPFSCHIRKMVPRGDLQLDQQQRHRILRRSIQFGPELSDEEKAQNKTLQDRGLYFACYQSNLQNGYHFIQKSWANNDKFPPNKGFDHPGYDPMFGQAAGDPSQRTVVGMDPKNPSKALVLPIAFVVPRGGEYFFSPSIPTLKHWAGLPGQAASQCLPVR